MALGSLAFTAVIPVGIVVAATLPGSDREGFSDALIDRFDLSGDSADAVRQVFAAPNDVKQSLSIAGAILLVVAVLSFTRALQRVFERAWGLPPLGYRATPAGLTWLVGIIIWVTVFSSLREWLEDLGGPILAFVIAMAFGTVASLLSPYVLLSRRVPWQRLVPTALLTAVAFLGLSIASAIYMPAAIGESADRYGTIGVAIALVSWLVTIGFAIALCAAVGSVLGEPRPEPAD